MSGGALEWARRPEYTGENRCLPCTAVNVAVAGVASVALGTVWVPLGAGALLVSLLAIYLRGYLVPYTPTLTKRYLPERVLAWFDKAPDPGTGSGDATDGAAVEATLRELGAVEECVDRDDLCMAPDFRAAWQEAVATYRDEDVAAAATRLLDVDDPERVTVEEGEDSLAVHVDGRPAGQWPSRAAGVADAAAAAVLAERDPRWTTRERAEHNALLNSLRLFVETCPACGGPVELGEERVESCCRQVEVAAATCVDCGARLFESALPEGAHS